MSLPDRALSNYDIEKAVKDLKIKKFRGCFMRDTLPKKPLKNECLVLNLDDSSGPGNHWLCLVKRGNAKVYFDSYGISPPPEVTAYLGKDVYYNSTQVQKAGYACAHFCLYILRATNDCNESNLLQVAQSSINKLF